MQQINFWVLYTTPSKLVSSHTMLCEVDKHSLAYLDQQNPVVESYKLLLLDVPEEKHYSHQVAGEANHEQLLAQEQGELMLLNHGTQGFDIIYTEPLMEPFSTKRDLNFLMVPSVSHFIRNTQREQTRLYVGCGGIRDHVWLWICASNPHSLMDLCHHLSLNAWVTDVGSTSDWSCAANIAYFLLGLKILFLPRVIMG